jgi:hypothetical protein
MPAQFNEPLDTDPSSRETVSLIASDKVQSTSVRRLDGEKIGTIERVMIDKRSGQVAYAVMSFGGFLGMGSDYRAVPWHALHYNEGLDAYEMEMTDDRLRGAPVLAGDDPDLWKDPRWNQSIHDYYGVPPFWH